MHMLLEGYTKVEISKRLDVTDGAVFGYIHKAHKILRTRLQSVADSMGWQEAA